VARISVVKICRQEIRTAPFANINPYWLYEKKISEKFQLLIWWKCLGRIVSCS
jgi:hypothetical protein